MNVRERTLNCVDKSGSELLSYPSEYATNSSLVIVHKSY